MKTLLLILFPIILSAQMEMDKHLLDVPDPGKGLFQAIEYEWNYKKTIGLSLLVISSLADGIREGYEFDGRKSFERKYGVKPISYAGSQSDLLAYKNNDVSQGFKSAYREWAGSPDLKHHLDDTRKYGYIMAGCFITWGGKKGKFKDTWKVWLTDAVIYSVTASVCKSAGMKWVRN